MESSIGTSSSLQSALKAKVDASSGSLIHRFQWPLFTAALLASDLAMTGFAFWLAHFVRFDLSLAVFQADAAYSVSYYRLLMLTFTPVWLGIFFVFGLYNRENLLGGTREYSQVFNASTSGLVLAIAAGFLLPGFIFARGWLLMAWAFAFFFTALGRFILRRIIYSLREQGYFLTPALIIGANEEGKLLAEQLVLWKSSGLLVLGFIDNTLTGETPIYQHLRAIGTVDQLPDLIKKYNVKELVITTSALTRSEIVSIFKQYGVSNGVTLRLSSGLFEIITTGLVVTELASVPLVRVNKARMTGVDRALKLALDYSITIPGLILISPLLLLIALAIRLESPGPVVYRRRVLGVNGVQFDAFKFRTMYTNGDEILAAYPELQAELAENHKLVDDPRVTRIGKLLRKASLDELPQLFNVLRGEMSLVGPRMIAPVEINKYEQWDMNLLTVPPGITGLWQVSGRSDVSYDERVRLDMHYIRNWSIWLDFKLLIDTLPAVIKGRGAY